MTENRVKGQEEGTQERSLGNRIIGDTAFQNSFSALGWLRYSAAALLTETETRGLI